MTQSWEAEALLKATVSESPVLDMFVRMGVLTSHEQQHSSCLWTPVPLSLLSPGLGVVSAPALLDMPAESCQKTAAFTPFTPGEPTSFS